MRVLSEAIVLLLKALVLVALSLSLIVNAHTRERGTDKRSAKCYTRIDAYDGNRFTCCGVQRKRREEKNYKGGKGEGTLAYVHISARFR